jgi:hypothetical protein
MQIQIAHDASANQFCKEALDSDSFRSTGDETNESSIRRLFGPALYLPKENCLTQPTSRSPFSASIGVATVAPGSCHARALRPHAARQRRVPRLPFQIFLRSSSSRSDSRGTQSIFFRPYFNFSLVRPMLARLLRYESGVLLR